VNYGKRLGVCSSFCRINSFIGGYPLYGELVWSIPFILLLTSIAVLPMISHVWWEKNFSFISIGLALLVLFHYAVQLQDTHSLITTAEEYFSFICLVGSLFVVSGGIHITVKGQATPFINSIFLLIGALLSNVMGTTGASIVFIRPWLRMNKKRLAGYHVVFFIFIVSNIGGALTPIGDPPLFLGYLKGVPFFWVFKTIWPIWLLALGLLIAIFFIIDTHNYKNALLKEDVHVPPHEEWRFEGLHNFFLLAVIVGAVFIDHPLFLREAIMILALVVSYRSTPKSVHVSNDFHFAPIVEVAVLFFGIFATMIPALAWLEKYAGQLGIHTPGQFFWWSGSLSSVLDNAPTYLNFLSTAQGLFHEGGVPASVASLLALHPKYVLAISVGAVFFGAMTYIGNGPNFLVRSIATRAHVKMPSFLGYVFKYALPVLLPIFFVIWFIFFRT
jgi:Na+/H+ antiporter NhaD/arsenite permease-like protein